MKCCAGSNLTIFILFLSIATLFGTEPGKQNVLNPANDEMCEIASLEMLSYSRCDLMSRVQALELLLEALLEQLSTELPIYTPKRDTSSIEKKKNEFIRFGKRKNEFIRFGKRKNEFTRFGISNGQNVGQEDQHNEDKRKNEFIRFG